MKGNDRIELVRQKHETITLSRWEKIITWFSILFFQKILKWENPNNKAKRIRAKVAAWNDKKKGTCVVCDQRGLKTCLHIDPRKSYYECFACGHRQYHDNSKDLYTEIQRNRIKGNGRQLRYAFLKPAELAVILLIMILGLIVLLCLITITTS